MLVAATILCLWLGVWANGAHRQRLAVQQISQLGGDVSYDRQAKEIRAPAWLRSIAGDDFFLKVVGVRLHGRKIDQMRRPLALEELDQAVGAITQLRRVRTLTLRNTYLSDEDYARLAPLASQIEELAVSEQRRMLTGSCVQYFRDWPRLRELTIYSIQLDSAMLRTIPHISNLQVLAWGEAQLNAEAFAAIAECKNLRVLTLAGCSFDGQALARLRAAPSLKTIDMHNIGAYPQLGSTSGSQKAAPPTDYYFSPVGDEQPISETSNGSSDADYEKWLKQLLPGVEVSWDFSS
jgi:hypothetical protein